MYEKKIKKNKKIGGLDDLAEGNGAGGEGEHGEAYEACICKLCLSYRAGERER